MLGTLAIVASWAKNLDIRSSIVAAKRDRHDVVGVILVASRYPALSALEFLPFLYLGNVGRCVRATHLLDPRPSIPCVRANGFFVVFLPLPLAWAGLKGQFIPVFVVRCAPPFSGFILPLAPTGGAVILSSARTLHCDNIRAIFPSLPCVLACIAPAVFRQFRLGSFSPNSVFVGAV
ncbi:MAG: hypothetical protein FD152_766 [Xanthobacteraceae bacterium]|nr:MAG: hypothetical protein FD152_766 [Xanthobacteraceae bacterium]